MASSKVMASSTTSVNSDLGHQSSSICSLSIPISELQSDQGKNFGSTFMDDIFKNIYGDNPSTPENFHGVGVGVGVGGDVSGGENRSAEEVWKEIVSGEDQVRRGGEMTLETFLTKAGAVREDEVRVAATAAMIDGQFQGQMQAQGVDGAIVAFGNGIDGAGAVAAVAPVGRGKRRTPVEEPVDKATQQKQRRMIKNRESAARSRERKQAYTVELETLVTKLEEENALLVIEEAEHTRERFKQLMENLIPITEKPPKKPGVLRRVHYWSE